jgi:hypothetical protein
VSPLAILALVLWPIVWLLTLPFRLVGIAIKGVLALLRAIVLLPGADPWESAGYSGLSGRVCRWLGLAAICPTWDLRRALAISSNG